MPKTIRIAMLGSGFVAGFYMQGLANVNGQEVVVNFSLDKKRAKKFAAAWNIPEHTTNLATLIERDDIDLYIIALPNDAHMTVSVLLAQAGRNQVCTKPLARNPEEAGRMLKAAAESDKMHGYAETEVFAPAVVKARQTIESGGIGKVLWVRSRESHSGPHSAHFWDVERTGGGAMNDLACHCIEAARYFHGKDNAIVEVMAWGDTLVHNKKTKGEDNALLILKFSSGGIAHCELSWTCKGGLDLRNEIHGSEGSIFTDVTRGTPITSFVSQPAGYVVEKADIDFGWTRPLPEEAFAYGYQAEMRHFVECVRDGTEPRETYVDGYAVNCVLDAGYQSMASKRWVKVQY
ncbi:Gfo/Idh/MocA family oxidoreductase [uncultured Paludibaculum sp.]|uniref:Gfo/Idh/MocA family protein n=1 Tax=uncultured Paludibaculum sp. TaxID=1765020 RepID=UPI002AABAE11|nr:Gfo/Idh/MocA family oxidoreductase [uncultured Paludibaculum sp.]